MKQIYAHEFNQFVNEYQPVLLDVRQEYEHLDLSIPNSILIPLDQIHNHIDELEQYKTKTILVYCKAGVRSQFACKILEDYGFCDLYNLADGILGWKYYNPKEDN